MLFCASIPGVSGSYSTHVISRNSRNESSRACSSVGEKGRCFLGQERGWAYPSSLFVRATPRSSSVVPLPFNRPFVSLLGIGIRRFRAPLPRDESEIFKNASILPSISTILKMFRIAEQAIVSTASSKANSINF